MTSRDEVLRTVRQKAAARVRAETALKKALRDEDIAIQDAAAHLDIKVRGTASVIAGEARRTSEHVRNIVRPGSERGHYAPTPD